MSIDQETRRSGVVWRLTRAAVIGVVGFVALGGMFVVTKRCQREGRLEELEVDLERQSRRVREHNRSVRERRRADVDRAHGSGTWDSLVSQAEEFDEDAFVRQLGYSGIPESHARAIWREGNGW